MERQRVGYSLGFEGSMHPPAFNESYPAYDEGESFPWPWDLEALYCRDFDWGDCVADQEDMWSEFMRARAELRYYPREDRDGFLFFGGQIENLAGAEKDSDGGVDYTGHLAGRQLVGGGWGRLLNRGPGMRLAEVERELRAAGSLSGPIPKQLGRDIALAWYELRNQIGRAEHLQTLLSALREAGLLIEEPSPAVTYRLVRILEDGHLDERWEGAMALVVADHNLIVWWSGHRATTVESWLHGQAALHLRRSPDRQRQRRFAAGLAAAPPIPSWGAAMGLVFVEGYASRYFYDEQQNALGALEWGCRLHIGLMEGDRYVYLLVYDYFLDPMEAWFGERAFQAEPSLTWHFARSAGSATSISASARAGIIGLAAELSLTHRWGRAKGYFGPY